MFVFWNPYARANLHQQKRALKLCSATLKGLIVLVSPNQSDRKGNNKVSKFKLKKYFFGEKHERKTGKFCYWMTITKGPGKRGHIVADTLLPTQMFPCLPARTTFVADTNFVSGTQKMYLILFRNILCPQQMFPSLRSPRNIMDNNVSATLCPCLPGP